MARSRLSLSDVARCWAGFASLGAGLVHLGVVRDHLDHWLLAAVFFVVVGVLQLGWGVAALARDRVPAARLVIVSTVAVVGVWGVSRTAGLPFGPDAGVAEPVGRADLLTVLLELLVVAAVVVAVRSGGRLPAVRRQRPGLALTALALGALVMSALTTPALAATEAGEQARPHFGQH